MQQKLTLVTGSRKLLETEAFSFSFFIKKKLTMALMNNQLIM